MSLSYVDEKALPPVYLLLVGRLEMNLFLWALIPEKVLWPCQEADIHGQRKQGNTCIQSPDIHSFDPAFTIH